MPASRYDREPFCTVLDFNDEHPMVTHSDRSMVILSSRRERLLWGVVIGSYPATIFVILFGILPIMFLAIVVLGLRPFWLMLLPLGLGFILACLLPLWNYIARRRELWVRSRMTVSIDEFISEGGLESEPRKVVAAIRIALGRSYAIKPEAIAPWDTKRTLYRLSIPFSFEVIVSAAHDLNVDFSDADVDRIAKRIPVEAKSVRDMVQLLSEELQKKKLVLSRPEDFDNG